MLEEDLVKYAAKSFVIILTCIDNIIAIFVVYIVFHYSIVVCCVSERNLQLETT